MSSIPESIVVEQLLEAPSGIVWEAITDKDQMRQWFFESISEFRPDPGFETEFVVHCDGTDYLHQWQVKEVEPGQRIAYRWRYGGYPGDSTVIWELAETPVGTRLLFTQEFHDSFPEDNPVFSREAGIAGWTWIVCKQLPAFLQQTARSRWSESLARVPPQNSSVDAFQQLSAIGVFFLRTPVFFLRGPQISSQSGVPNYRRRGRP